MSFFDDAWEGGLDTVSSGSSDGGFLGDSVFPKLEYTFERGLDFYLESLWTGEDSVGVYDSFTERSVPIDQQPVEQGFSFGSGSAIAIGVGLLIAAVVALKLVK